MIYFIQHISYLHISYLHIRTSSIINYHSIIYFHSIHHSVIHHSSHHNSSIEPPISSVPAVIQPLHTYTSVLFLFKQLPHFNALYYFILNHRHLNNFELQQSIEQYLVQSSINDAISNPNFYHLLPSLLKSREFFTLNLNLHSDILEILDREESFVVAISTILSLNLKNTKAQTVSKAIANNIFIHYCFDTKSSISKFKARYNINEEILVNIGLSFINPLISGGLFTLELLNSETSVIVPHPSVLTKLRNIMLPTILDIPMVVEPKPWSMDPSVYGGFLLNQQLQEPLVHIRPIDNHLIILNEFILYALNKLAQSPLSINRLLLMHIITSPKLFIELISRQDFMNTLGVAIIYAQFNQIYFPLFIDWRGRIYSHSHYLNYQSNELAKALLILPDNHAAVLTEDGLNNFMINGAKLYGLDKLTHNERIDWVKHNLNDICSLNDNFIFLANDPILFLSWALHFKMLIDSNYTYRCTCPIYLDATCSGTQHLAAMIANIRIAQLVNLNPGSYDKVFDIYQVILEAVIKKLRSHKDIKFRNLLLTRSQIKRPVMTINYSVTNFSIANMLKDVALGTHKINNIIHYTFNSVTGEAIHLDHKQLYNLGVIIKNTYMGFDDDLLDLWNYFLSISKLFSKLGLSIHWIAPSGVEVVQHYLKTTKFVHYVKTFSTTKQLTYQRVKIPFELNKDKVSAMIPNLIHTLDATMVHQTLHLYDDIIFTIHDCFIINANRGSVLRSIINRLFIQNYITTDYLKAFHNNILKQLSMLLSKDWIDLDKNQITLYHDNGSTETLNIPKLPRRGKLSIADLIKATYHIN